jgi:hypothetical protein
MDTAHCTVNNQRYLAFNFAQLQPAEKAQKRHALICPECDGVAYFRKASKSGQAACFGARHEENCSLTAGEYEQNSIGPGDDQNILENSGQHIILDFNFGAVDDRHNDQDAPPNAGGRGGRFTAGYAKSNAEMHRRLSTILTNLVTSDQFRASQQIIEIPGSGEFTVKDFFVQLKDATSTHINEYRGYWGKIVNARPDARFGNNALWLNSGNHKDMSVCIPEHLINLLCERFRISRSNVSELNGKYLLVIGSLIAAASGKKYVQVADLGYVTIK